MVISYAHLPFDLCSEGLRLPEKAKQQITNAVNGLRKAISEDTAVRVSVRLETAKNFTVTFLVSEPEIGTIKVKKTGRSLLKTVGKLKKIVIRKS